MLILKKIKRFWRYLGAGLITGAADDDPAGVATYAIAGSRLGFSSLWTAFFTYPLMTAIQEMCARIGVITKMGLAGVLKKHYPFWVLILVALLMVSSNTFNIGADIAGMSAATNLIIPWVPTKLLAVLYSALIIYMMVFWSFKKILRYLKWLTLTLLFYVATALLISHDWAEIFRRLITPKLHLNKETISLIIAIFGTTISPYLFFWQTTEEAVEEKNHYHEHQHIHDEKLKKELIHTEKDVAFGMFFSNFIMFFIMVLSTTLFFNKNVNIRTIGQLSELLGPLLGKFGQFIFTLGIVGTGLLVIPVLAGGSAYIVAETFGLREGLDKKLNRAKGFYAIIVVSTILALVLALVMNYFGLEPILFLFYTALFQGMISPLLILAILSISNNKKIMGSYVNSTISNILGFGAFMVMTVAVIFYFIL